MTDGMKPGRGDDPFADEPDDDTGDEQEPTDERSVRQDEPTEVGKERPEDQGLPLIYRRETVKSGRKQKPIFLQEETLDREGDFQETVATILDEDVKLLDLREAALVVAMEHPGEVADQLREWGYDYR